MASRPKTIEALTALSKTRLRMQPAKALSRPYRGSRTA